MIDPRKMDPSRFSMSAERYAEIKELNRAAKKSMDDYRFRDLPVAEKLEFSAITRALPSPALKRQQAAERKRMALLDALARERDEQIRALSKEADLAR